MSIIVQGNNNTVGNNNNKPTSRTQTHVFFETRTNTDGYINTGDETHELLMELTGLDFELEQSMWVAEFEKWEVVCTLRHKGEKARFSLVCGNDRETGRTKDSIEKAWESLKQRSQHLRPLFEARRIKMEQEVNALKAFLEKF